MVIHKIGVVPLARSSLSPTLSRGEREKDVRLLIHKPKPKQGDADIAWGLARGTRMFFDIDGNVWRDARDRVSAEMFRDRLEAPVQTAWREMAEELDVLESEMEAGLRDLGVFDYASTQKMAYPIQWFSGWVTNPERVRVPVDAAAVKWVTLTEVHAMVERGEFKASYVSVVESVLGKMV